MEDTHYTFNWSPRHSSKMFWRTDELIHHPRCNKCHTVQVPDVNQHINVVNLCTMHLTMLANKFNTFSVVYMHARSSQQLVGASSHQVQRQQQPQKERSNHEKTPLREEAIPGSAKVIGDIPKGSQQELLHLFQLLILSHLLHKGRYLQCMLFASGVSAIFYPYPILLKPQPSVEVSKLNLQFIPSVP